MKVGAFSSLISEVVFNGMDRIDHDGFHRTLLLKAYDEFVRLKGATKKGRPSFEKELFDMESRWDELTPVSVVEMSAWERELMAFNVLYSPFTMNGREEKVQKFFDAGVVFNYDEFIESDEQVGRLAVILKDWKERPQRNGQMFAFLKFGTRDGREFEAPAFSAIWKFMGQALVRGDLYIATFNRKDDDPQRLVVGEPGWGHTRSQCLKYFIRIDDLE